jgi:two-component system, NarL family, sensor kinase
MTSSNNKRLLVSIVLAVVAAAIAIVGMRNVPQFQTEVFERLMIAFGESETALKAARGDAVLRDACSWSVAILLSYVGVLIGWKLPAIPRIFAFLQPFGVSLLLTWAAWKYLQISLEPVTFIVSIALGLAGGYTIRRWDEADIRMQSQFYQLSLRNNELRDVRLQMVRQDEVERRMLAADLHDQVLNDMKRLRKKFELYAKDRSDEQKAEIDQILAATMVEIREVMDSLCPSALEHLGLSAALEDCLRKAGEKGGFKARFKSKLDDSDVEKLSLVEQSLLYRLVQEALTNVIKHAEAKTVRLNAEKDGESLLVTVSDDGKGIPEGKMNEDSRGLRYMRQRADLIGATISFRAGEGVGSPGAVVEIRVDLAGRSAIESSGS